MKKIFLFSLMLLSIFGFSQTSADIGKIQLSIHFSEEQQNSFDYDLLTQMLSEN